MCTFCVASLPSLEMHVGPRASTMVATMFPCLGVVAFMPMWGGFQGGGGGGIESLGGGGGSGGNVVTSVAVAIHVLLVVCCLGSLRLAEASMKSLAPSFVPKKEQGKAFGTMATVRFPCCLLCCLLLRIFTFSSSNFFLFFTHSCVVFCVSPSKFQNSLSLSLSLSLSFTTHLGTSIW